MTFFLRAATLAILTISTIAFAQQPGSQEYNTVFLPAHGVGDTARPNVRWGGLARGADKTLGWYVGAQTEQEAVKLAIQDCVARGSTNCEGVETFFNSCAAVAVGPANRTYSKAPASLSSVRKRALKNCGSPECKILFEGCARP
ncbi:DUF4189 domain-containing protein [Stenotrophomonas sp. S41]|nr:DUF4189 domain-containing protein [Stenotrophomonas sp. S41]